MTAKKRSLSFPVPQASIALLACVAFFVWLSFPQIGGEKVAAEYGAPFIPIAAAGELDPTYLAGVGGETRGVHKILLQPDGKQIIAFNGNGNYGTVNGRGRRYIARLYEDGSVDETFDTGVGVDHDIYAMAIQDDGKILIGGSFGTFTDENGSVQRLRIARLDIDGSLDYTFLPFGGGASAAVTDLVIRPDGKIFIVGGFSSVGGVARGGVALLNSDGSVDPSFSPSSGIGTPGTNYITSIALQPDGKIVIGGLFTSFNGTPINRIARVLPTGDLDTTFNIGSGSNSTVNKVALQSDGKILIGGLFWSYNGVAAVSIVRINADGSHDPTFLEGGPLTTGHRNISGGATDISTTPEGKVYVASPGESQPGLRTKFLSRFNSDGTLDSSFPQPVCQQCSPPQQPRIVLQEDGKVVSNILRPLTQSPNIGSKLTRFDSNGSQDATYNPITLETGAIFDSALQPDGKLIVAGAISAANTTVGGLHLARFNPDGTRDQGFNPSASWYVYEVLLQPDGKILIAGIFGAVNGTTRTGFARLNADGTLDNTFSGHPNGYAYGLARQPDGKILVGGSFLNYNGVPMQGLARVNPDGSLDQSFNIGTGFSFPHQGTNVDTIQVQPDGKILVAGDFTSFNGTALNRITRLNADGSLDTSFNPGTGANAPVRALMLLGDGKIMVGGEFTQFNGVARGGIARLNSDGSLDTSFGNGAAANSWVNELYVQSDGRVIIGGTFSTVGGQTRRGIARIHPNGTLDTSFLSSGRGAEPMTGFAGSFGTAIAVDEGNNHLYFGGRFTTFNNRGRASLARLTLNSTCTYTIDPASTQVSSSAGNGSFAISTQAGCEWSAVSNVPWITTSSSGNSDGTVDFNVEENVGPQRSGTITVGGETFTVNQAAACINAVPVALPVNATANPGGILTVPISVGDVTGRNVIAYDLTVSFDNNVLTPLAGEPISTSGTLSSSFVVTPNASVPGEISVAAFGVAPLSGQGTLLNLRFQVIGANNSSSPLVWTSFNFNEGEPCSSTANGSVNVINGTIAGNVQYGITTQGQKPVSGVTLTASGTPQVVATSATNGDYLLSGLGSGAYTVTPAKSGGVNGISAFDAALTAQYSAGTISLTPNQLVAADASNNGVVSAFDAALIAQSSAGVPNNGIVGQWKFVPPNRTYAQVTSDQTGQHYDAVLVGEVSGNWQVPAVLEELKLWKQEVRAEDIVGGIPVGFAPGMTGDSGSSVTIPITVGELTGQNVIAYDFEIHFDPAVLIPSVTPATSAGTASSAFTITPNASVPGELRIAAFGTQALSGSGVLLNLHFDVVGSPGETSNLTWDTFQFNEGVPESAPVAGTFTVNGPAQADLAPYDFDGDGKTDVSVFRPAGGEWWYGTSSNGGHGAAVFGTGSDVIAPADYTGDGKTDMAFFRPSSGEWFFLRSEDFSFYSFPFGGNGDIPAPADYDGDGKADAAVYRPSTGTWYVFRSSDGQVSITGFGVAGDRPIPADYDGDGMADIGIFRPNGTNGAEWWVLRSTAGLLAVQFGGSDAKAVPGDYTGDGKADVAFFGPGGEWYILRSEDLSFYSFPFGVGTDIPVPGDYDGDGRIDAAVFRNSSATWFMQGTNSGTMITAFGVPGDRPVPNAFVR